jgi:hypothetical protein
MKILRFSPELIRPLDGHRYAAPAFESWQAELAHRKACDRTATAAYRNAKRISESADSFFKQEPTGRANARPMTGSAKQSIFLFVAAIDCFAALAMTRKRDYAIPRRAAPESCMKLSPIRGCGERRVPAAPAASCA